MGVIAQNSTDVTLRRVVVEPSGTRKFSIACDATHFVGCRGRVLIEDCRFQNQFDDAVNAHGLYTQVVRRLGERSVRIRIVHPQHQGVWGFKPGDRIAVQAAPYLVPRGEVTLASITPNNSETADLTFTEPLPPGLQPFDLLENLTAYPELTIRNCVIRWNRARGILLNGRGRIVVEGNTFETAGSAILLESSPIWGESGPIADLIVRDNTFRNCAHSPMWGKAVISAATEFRHDAPKDLPPFHGKLTVQKNRFERCAAAEVQADSFTKIVRD